MALPDLAVLGLAWLLGLVALLLTLPGVVAAIAAAKRPVGPAGAYRPHATVIVPARGHHPGLEENARAIAAQDYPQYEVLFVVDGTDDPCYPVLQRVQRDAPRLKVVLSEPALVGEWPSGKMVAQLTGVRRANPRSEVLVFADADARPSDQWLACLAAPLENPKVGVVSGFRWYHAQGQPTFWTLVRDAWDHTGVGAMLNKKVRLVWGGSMAVRKADFLRGPVLEAWKHSMSDDVSLARAYEQMGLDMVFAPGAMAASPEDGEGRDILEFMTREMAILRASHPEVYAGALKIHGLFVALLLLGLATVALAQDAALRLAGALMLLPWLVAVPRNWLRERMVLRALPFLRARPRRERWLTLLLSFEVSFLMLLLWLRVRGMREVTWRGRTYALDRARGEARD